ncbi:MAG: hypothetical protein R3337_07945 [Gammaproteobacteria bacterium]|nr:hypothetical protein [Gammaproteobacteria bacterium]
MRLLLILLLAPAVAVAEIQYITIPGEGWHLTIDAPPLTNTEAKARGRIFRYLASSVETGVTVSVNTETSGSGSNAECRQRYWSKTQTSPMLVKGSENVFQTDAAHFSTYRSEGVYKGEPFKTANAHAYIAKDGICADVHVSHWPYTEDSDALVAAIITSVMIVD